jgi:hypothetical protein
MNLTVKERNILIEAIRIRLNDASRVLKHLIDGKYEPAVIDICNEEIDIYLTIINKLQNA